jgi:hypothetical protein
VVLHAQSEYPADKPIIIAATVASADVPDTVSLQVLGGGAPVAMHRTGGYDYAATLPAGSVPDGSLRFTVGVAYAGKVLTFPHDSPVASTRAESYGAEVVPESSPLALFDPARDIANLAVSRSGESRNRVAKAVDGSHPGTPAYPLAFPTERMTDDFTASLYVGDRVADRGPAVAGAKAIRIRLRALEAPSVIRVTLVEKDGSAWSAKVFASRDWRDAVVPISSLRSAKSAMLPQAYPGTWSYWLSPPEGSTAIHLAQVERLQFSLRRPDFGTISSVDAAQASVAIESAALDF